MRWSDASKLEVQQIKPDNEGFYWLEFEQTKTGKRVSIPLLDRALDIVKKYQDSVESKITRKILPIISNQKVNAYLKVITELTGIQKKLTHHVARHTFSTTITCPFGDC